MNFKPDEFFGRHPDVLAQETEFVELSSFFCPKDLIKISWVQQG